jgi:hypothetical protein
VRARGAALGAMGPALLSFAAGCTGTRAAAALAAAEWAWGAPQQGQPHPPRPQLALLPPPGAASAGGSAPPSRDRPAGGVVAVLRSSYTPSPARSRAPTPPRIMSPTLGDDDVPFPKPLALVWGKLFGSSSSEDALPPVPSANMSVLPTPLSTLSDTTFDSSPTAQRHGGFLPSDATPLVGSPSAALRRHQKMYSP